MMHYEPGDWVEIGEVFDDTSTHNPDWNSAMVRQVGEFYRVNQQRPVTGWLTLDNNSWVWHPEWLKPVPPEKAVELSLEEPELIRSLELYANYKEKNRDPL